MDIKKKIEDLKKDFSNTCDLITKELTTKDSQKVALVFIDNVVDQLILTTSVISPLQDLTITSSTDIADTAMQRILSYSQVSEVKTKTELINGILNGFCAILFENSEKILIVKCVKWIVRLPVEPPTSAVVKGPREGFVEDIMTNISLIRKRLKTPTLKIENFKIGRKTNSEVRLLYLVDVADPLIIDKVRAKLNQIDIDGIVDSNYISEYLSAGKHYLFKQIGYTEKPDIATAKMLEGRVVILVDGSPIALTIPFILLEDLQSSNDYYTAPMRATFLRFLRLFAGLLAILLPGIYVAVLCHHIKVIPIKILITITNSIQGIPLSPLLEMLFIIFLFETLYEASLRMPRYLGLALSVVGALILGETAVSAGLVSPPAVLIVAITGVMSYTLPELTSQISLLRLIFTILGGFMGIFGLILGTVFLIGYLANMDSYGSPYLAPFAPKIKSDLKDGLMRTGIPNLDTLPKSIKNKKKRRTQNDRTDN